MLSRFVECRYGCGQKVTFDENFISKSGKKIPIGENERAHDCPKTQHNMKKHQGQQHQDRRAHGLNLTSTPVDEEVIRNSRFYIEGVNKRLTEHTIRLVINPLHRT